MLLSMKCHTLKVKVLVKLLRVCDTNVRVV